MEPMLYGALSHEGGMTRRAAILQGWNLAKSLAKDTVLTKVKIAQTNLFGVSLVAMKNNNMTVDRGQLQTVTENLVKDYARLKPASHFDHDDYESSYGYRGANFLDAVWRMGANAVAYRARYSSETEIGEKKVVQFAINDLTEMSKGSIDLLEALKVSSRMLQVAPRVSQLSQDSHGYQYGVRIANYTYYEWGTKQGSLRTASFLDKLMDFGFEIARSNPTITLGLNSSAEWVDTLWEGKTTWTNKEKESVAIGMSEWMDGFRTKPATPNDVAYGWSSYWGTVRNNRALSEKAFDYAGRLMQAARAIDDVNLKPEVKKADFLSHLVNLGGGYAVLNPNQDGTQDFFLHTAWENSTSANPLQISQQLRDFLGTSTKSTNLMNFQTNLVRGLSFISDPNKVTKQSKFTKDLMGWGSEFHRDENDQDGENNTFDPYKYCQGILKVNGNQSIKIVSQSIARTDLLRGPTTQEGVIVNAMSILARNARQDRVDVANGGREFASAVEQSRNQWFTAVRSYNDTNTIPNELKALTWGLFKWAKMPGEYANTVTIPSGGYAVRDFKGTPGNPVSTCNRFVGDAYAMGAGVGYGVNGKNGTYPTGEPTFLDPRPGYPVDANELSSDKTATGVLTNLPRTYNPKFGDIISFAPDYSDPDPTGHTGLFLGNGIYISARRGPSLGNQVSDGIMITAIPSGHSILYRTFQP
jgi:hypothetical protein